MFPRHKYRAKRVERDGRSFASGAEAALYGLLKIEESQGLVSNIRCQVQVHLTEARIIYKPDFLVFDETIREEVYCEFKGFETPCWRIKLRLWKNGYGPGRLRIYKGTANKVYLHEEVIPQLPKKI